MDEGERGTLTGPGGEQTGRRTRNNKERGGLYPVQRSRGEPGPRQARCRGPMPKQGGRSVRKNDDAGEEAAARGKAGRGEYAEGRRPHGRIERTFAEGRGRHRGGWMRYRGRARGRIQDLRTGRVVNSKQLVRLLRGQEHAAGASGAG